jgi:hypothetical protein
MRDLLLELGRGFAFVGSQVPLTVGEETGVHGKFCASERHKKLA